MARSLADRLLPALDPGLDHVELRRQAAEVVRSALGHDLAAWATVDPTTVMWTSCVLDGADRDEDLERAVFTNEYGAQDVLKMADLARGDLAAGLHLTTGGDPASSARFRDVFHPRGFSDELRVVFSDGTTPWGALNLLRSDGAFTRAEVDAVRGIVTPFAVALRESLLRTRADRHLTGRGAEVDPATFVLGEVTAGLVLCDRDGRVREVTPEARQLLGEGRLPPAVTSLVLQHRHGTATGAVAARGDGTWLSFQTMPLGAGIAVVVDRIRPGRMADLIVRGRGLSSREREVLDQLVRGRANKQIARTLGISEWTVQDHVKAVLAKFGVGSRAELVSAVFFEHYAPLHAGDVEA